MNDCPSIARPLCLLFASTRMRQLSNQSSTHSRYRESVWVIDRWRLHSITGIPKWSPEKKEVTHSVSKRIREEAAQRNVCRMCWGEVHLCQCLCMWRHLMRGLSMWERVCVCSFFYTCRTSGDAYSWIRESATVAWRKIAFQVVASSECVQRKRRKRMRWRRREKSVLSESLSWPTCGLHFCKIACPAQRDKIAWTRIEFRVSAVQGRAGTAVAKTQRTSGNETEREG